MTDAVYTARTPEQLGDICQRLGRVEIPRNGLDVFAREHKVLRTHPQNSRLWWLHNLRAAHLNQTWPERAAGLIALMEKSGVALTRLERSALLHKVWTEDDMHAEFKKRYCAGKSSTKVSKIDMMGHQEAYEANMLNEEGVEIPDFEPQEEARA